MSTKKVFVAEDDEDIRLLIDYILKDDLYQVQLFPDVNTLKKGLSLELPDLIVLDIMLPDGDGVEICRQLKEDAATAHIPVLLMSAHRSQREIQGNTHSDGFISKPFDINRFKAKIDAYMMAS
ncbi:response regulator [Mucilaginibacter sabulilitoris]|uniref:Response regulator n=1 Tax=Mucilaginibacter sabulilitoris TaxID=1173583 RepID=A0ABZ0TIK0_9SPHI|nr:response regulator [Mucilaginibacter sabulilitoris]WPU92863.1 response regulator [Mucilaginibacter sabulilitoris]